jgi:hypothetical protein
MSRGAKQNENQSTKFLNFQSGKFVQRVKPDTTGATARVLEKGPNSGTTVHELHFDSYEGAILNIETEASEYGQKLNILMDVSTEEEPEAKVKITLPLSSGPAKGFLSRLPVIDFKKDVCLCGYNIKNDAGKFNSYLVPYQDGVKLNSYYTKDTPNGLPQMQQIKVKGNLVWDDTEQIEFFEALILEHFPKAGGNVPQASAQTQADPEPMEQAPAKKGTRGAF